MHVLDNPVWHALDGPQRAHGRVVGRAARFHPEIGPFAALAGPADAAAWSDLAVLAGPDGLVSLVGDPGPIAPGWTFVRAIAGVQMVGTGVRPEADPEAEALGPDDSAAMLDLVERAEPGPFLPRTVELGGYLGYRAGGRLVAMAGERLRPPGFAEISAVATDPDHRARGMASRLVRAVADGIVARGETPFLHAAAANERAVRLYGTLGFAVRREVVFVLLRAPAPTGPGPGEG